MRLHIRDNLVLVGDGCRFNDFGERDGDGWIHGEGNHINKVIVDLCARNK